MHRWPEHDLDHREATRKVRAFRALVEGIAARRQFLSPSKPFLDPVEGRAEPIFMLDALPATIAGRDAERTLSQFQCLAEQACSTDGISDRPLRIRRSRCRRRCGNAIGSVAGKLRKKQAKSVACWFATRAGLAVAAHMRPKRQVQGTGGRCRRKRRLEGTNLLGPRPLIFARRAIARSSTGPGHASA